MRNIILADCNKDELNDFKEGLEESSHERFVINSYVSNWGRTTLWKKVKRYLVYFVAPVSIFINRKKYKIIVGWQQFYSIIFAFYCKIFKVKKTFNLYVLNFTYKEKHGLIGKIYFYFMKNIINSKYIDYLYVPSNDYIIECEKKLGVNRDKFVVLPFGIPDRYNKYKEDYIKDNYYLSIGRSNRDYDWLVSEWQNIDEPLYIISDNYTPTVKISNNIKIINNIAGDAQYPFIMGSKALIIPIKVENICSGDTVLLTAMSFKKRVIVTENSTLAEMYIDDGINGCVVSKNHGCLQKTISKIKNKNNIGIEARKTYEKKYSRRNMGITFGKSLKECK